MLVLALTAMPGVVSGSEPKTDPSAVAAGDSSADPLAAAAAAAAASDQILLLEVEVNGRSIGKIGEFTLRHGTLLARPGELRGLGLKVPDILAAKPGSLVALSDLPGLTWNIDEKNLVLHVTVNESRLVPTRLQPEGTQGPEEHRVIESGTGMTANYDVVETLASGQNGASGSLDVRAFSPLGIASSGWLAYAGANSSSPGSNEAIRLDSAYTFSDVNSLRRYGLGDFVTSGLSWTRPVRLAGAQIRSDFSMRPDLVTFPMPSISGSTAVPSTVSVLADGNLVASSEIAPGPFEIPQLPVVSGAGTISMTMTNAMGQQVTVTQPFYASSALLAPGLKTFAAQAGLVRRNWGAASNDYGKMAGGALLRGGLSPKFTFEASGEGTPGAFMIGGGGVLQVANLGVVNFSAAASEGSAGPGEQFSAGVQRIGRVFSIGASGILGTRSYRDVASMNGDGIPRKQLSAFTSLSLRRYGTAGAAYAEIAQDASPNPIKMAVVAPLHSQVISANYSLQFHRLSIYAAEFKSFGGTGSNGLQVGVTIPLARRSSANVSVSSDGSGQLQVQQSATLIGEWGYQAYASAGNSNHEFGQVQYKSPVGLFSAGVDNSAGQITMRLESQGALSFVDRDLFPSNTIYDSFAIVDTSPLPHVHVLQENRKVGITSSSGRLLVPDMRSFDLNRIAIEATDLPADVSIQSASREMRPQDRSGVVVKFPIKISHGALLLLVDGAGVPVPLGSSAKLEAGGVAVPVGYDGEAYVEDLSSYNELTVELPNGRHCTVVFDYRPAPGDIPTIGPLRCVEQRP